MKTFEIPDQASFSTKEVTAITGMTKDALKYYEHLNIMGPIKRDHNNYRQYSQRNLERLRFVQIFQTLGMDLNLLTNTESEPTDQQKAADLREYRQNVRQQITRLESIDQFLTKKIDYFEK